MKSSSLIVWLLVAACIAIDLAMIGELQIRRNEWPGAGGLIGLGLTFSQVALLAMWAVLGRRNVLVRGVVSLLAVWMLGYLAAFSSGERAGTWFGVLMFYCAVSLIPLTILRFTGYKLASRESVAREKSNDVLSSKQFSIWGILSLMTAIGITLGVVRFAQFPLVEISSVASFFSVLSATSCTLLMFALYLRHFAFSVAAMTIMCPIAGLLLSLTGLAPGEGTVELVLMMCVQGMTLLTAAYVLRNAGYRLVRDESTDLTTASESSVASGLESEGPADEP